MQSTPYMLETMGLTLSPIDRRRHRAGHTVLGAVEHNVQTSNRRWRDDEFLLPRKLTEGRSRIRVRVEFVRKDIPLFPGQPLSPQAWSEFRYSAYCYVMPKVR
jgi:hypothetical protein